MRVNHKESNLLKIAQYFNKKSTSIHNDKKYLPSEQQTAFGLGQQP